MARRPSTTNPTITPAMCQAEALLAFVPEGGRSIDHHVT